MTEGTREVKRLVCEGYDHDEREAREGDPLASVRVKYTDYAALQASETRLRLTIEEAIEALQSGAEAEALSILKEWSR